MLDTGFTALTMSSNERACRACSVKPTRGGRALHHRESFVRDRREGGREHVRHPRQEMGGQVNTRRRPPRTPVGTIARL